ncbi:hypothetical protein sphantq_04726 (plasmid) [Sphingobium sp. AntQ-1]|nr:hypothetical protein sphantq_04726 [Sphingobium sp. AntQ-1]
MATLRLNCNHNAIECITICIHIAIYARRYPFAERIAPERGKVGLWRAKGEFWGMDSPVASRQPLTWRVIPRGSSPGLGRPGRLWSAAWSLTSPYTYQKFETGLSGPQIAPVATFPPPPPSRSDRRPIRLAFLESQFARVALGAVAVGEAQCLNNLQSKQIACRRSRLIMGMPGGRIAKAIRGGHRPRAGGAKPQEAVFFFFSGAAGVLGPKLSTGRATPKLTVRLLIQGFFLDSRFRGLQVRRNPRGMTAKSERWGRVA